MLTLASFFDPPKEAILSAVKSPATVAQNSPLQQLQAVLVGPFAETLHQEVLSALEISITGILIRAWGQNDAVKEQLMADGTSLVPLGEHSIESTHNPYVQIYRAGVPFFKLEFAVVFTVSVEGLVLKIRSHRIQEIAAGKFTASGELQCETVTLVRKESMLLDIPAAYAIAPEEDAALAAGSD